MGRPTRASLGDFDRMNEAPHRCRHPSWRSHHSGRWRPLRPATASCWSGCRLGMVRWSNAGDLGSGARRSASATPTSAACSERLGSSTRRTFAWPLALWRPRGRDWLLDEGRRCLLDPRWYWKWRGKTLSAHQHGRRHPPRGGATADAARACRAGGRAVLRRNARPGSTRKVRVRSAAPAPTSATAWEACRASASLRGSEDRLRPRPERLRLRDRLPATSWDPAAKRSCQRRGGAGSEPDSDGSASHITTLDQCVVDAHP